MAVAILVLFLLVFGGYHLWRGMRTRRPSKLFSSVIEAPPPARPQAISDRSQRAALDKLRQRFQTGMLKFKTQGKNIYKLPWYVIIGESGSGKSGAIHHLASSFHPDRRMKCRAPVAPTTWLGGSLQVGLLEQARALCESGQGGKTTRHKIFVTPAERNSQA